MSMKSIVRELKEIRDGIGSISRRGGESRHWLSRTKSHVAPDVLVTPFEPIQQGQWANLPPELLSDIIRRVEEICKSWRSITKEIVKTP
ncbi:F-box protein [Sesbania bispinosa]|nr:F-box protein [Sesbania bispinosa]